MFKTLNKMADSSDMQRDVKAGEMFDDIDFDEDIYEDDDDNALSEEE